MLCTWLQTNDIWIVTYKPCWMLMSRERERERERERDESYLGVWRKSLKRVSQEWYHSHWPCFSRCSECVNESDDHWSVNTCEWMNGEGLWSSFLVRLVSPSDGVASSLSSAWLRSAHTHLQARPRRSRCPPCRRSVTTYCSNNKKDYSNLVKGGIASRLQY